MKIVITTNVKVMAKGIADKRKDFLSCNDVFNHLLS